MKKYTIPQTILEFASAIDYPYGMWGTNNGLNGSKHLHFALFKRHSKPHVCDETTYYP